MTIRQQFRYLPIAILIAASVGPDTARSQGMPPTLVEVDSVRSLEFNEQVTLVGRSEGTSSSAIVSEVVGRVAAIVAVEGNPIKKGETLIEIDSDRMRLDLMAKEGEFIEAREQFELAKKDQARSEDLFERKLISDLAFDSAEAWIKIAEGRLQKLTAERDRLAKDLEDCKVRAPYSGFTSRRLISIGEWVNRGTPVYEMADISKLRVVVDLPERYYGRLSVGSPAFVVGSADTLTPLQGKVTGVSRSANAETHTYPIILEVDNQELKLGGGALVRVTLSFDQIFSSASVSKDAVVRQGSQSMVYTIQEGKAAPIPVTVTATLGNAVAITGPGIAPGLVVIVRGNERVFPGAPVRTIDAPSQDPSALPDTAGQAAQ